MKAYIYKIIFEDGCWYWGFSTWKGKQPHRDGYYGSPSTHKEKWKTTLFSKIIVKEFDSEEEAAEYELTVIRPDLNNPKCLNEHAGVKFSRETCSRAGQKAAEKSRGVPRTAEVKEKIASSHRGKKFSPEHIQKLKDALRPPVTPESTRKRVETRKANGYSHSAETREKMSNAAKGRFVSDSVREKISNSISGFKWYNNGKESIQSPWGNPSNKDMRWFTRDGENKMFSTDPGGGWVLGMYRPKGKRYYNNGSEHVLAYEPPSSDWIPGRLRKS